MNNNNKLLEFLEICYEQKKSKIDEWESKFARPEQKLPNGNWIVWLILAGRGWGKTRTGSEAVKKLILSNQAKYIALVGRTELEVIQIMVEGESGLLNVFNGFMDVKCCFSKRKIYFANGAVAKIYSSDQPNQLRGAQQDLAWCDELSSWHYPEENWSNLVLGLRLGKNPKVIVTTTPKPIRIINDFRRRSLQDNRIVITRGNSHENLANLSDNFVEILNQYKGTKLERQEIFGEIINSNENNLWDYDVINRYRVSSKPEEFQSIIISIDPAVTGKESSDETGIMVVASDFNGHGYVLEDLSGHYSPIEWSKIVNDLYYKWNANLVIGEVNQGGDLVENNLRITNPNLVYKSVRASKGKIARYQPISFLYAKGLIHHIGVFYELEKQMVESTNNDDRLDSLVWGLAELFLQKKPVISNLLKPKIRTLDWSF